LHRAAGTRVHCRHGGRYSCASTSANGYKRNWAGDFSPAQGESQLLEKRGLEGPRSDGGNFPAYCSQAEEGDAEKGDRFAAIGYANIRTDGVIGETIVVRIGGGMIYRVDGVGCGRSVIPRAGRISVAVDDEVVRAGSEGIGGQAGQSERPRAAAGERPERVDGIDQGQIGADIVERKTAKTDCGTDSDAAISITAVVCERTGNRLRPGTAGIVRKGGDAGAGSHGAAA